MSKRTRYFVMIAAAILAVGLTTGLVASFVGLPVVFSQPAGPPELQYVPADAAVVAYADVRQIMDSEFRERFRQFEPDTSARDEFEKKTGINIDEDIQSVVAALLPGAAGSAHPEHTVVILARGRFQLERLEALALAHGGTVEDYAGRRLLVERNADGERDLVVGFVEADLVALGGYDAVRRAIEAGRGVSVVSNTELMRQVNEIDASSAWAVGRFDAIARNAPRELQPHLPAIQWFSASTQINGGVSGVFKAEARDEQAAQNLRDVVRGILAVARMSADSRPELQAMTDSLQLSGEGTSIAVSFTLPSEFFDALAELKAHGDAR